MKWVQWTDCITTDILSDLRKLPFSYDLHCDTYLMSFIDSALACNVKIWYRHFLICIIYLFLSELDYVGYTAYDGMTIVKVLDVAYFKTVFLDLLRRLKKNMINITPLSWLLNVGPSEYKAGVLITLSQNVLHSSITLEAGKYISRMCSEHYYTFLKMWTV